MAMELLQSYILSEQSYNWTPYLDLQQMLSFLSLENGHHFLLLAIQAVCSGWCASVCDGHTMKARKVEGLCGASDESSVILSYTLS